MRWQPEPPRYPANSPAAVSTLPPGARALLARLDALAERAIATCPALAEAIRRDAAEREERERREHAAD